VVRTGEFVPALTEAGKRHAVTAPLDGRKWGGWMRYIESTAETGDTVLAAPDGRPLLVLDRVDQGRVGMLMSDQIWLWARGYDGGGPFSELIRRVVHWLMKEPELEERRLKLTAEGDTARVELRTLMDTAPPLQIETPEGDTIEPAWTETGPGQFTAEAPIGQLGLYRARAGGSGDGRPERAGQSEGICRPSVHHQSPTAAGSRHGRRRFPPECRRLRPAGHPPLGRARVVRRRQLAGPA
jgi:hypothetical protein